MERFVLLVRAQAGILALMFLLGIGANLFVDIPSAYSDSFWASPGAWVVALHLVLAWVALAFAILIYRSSQGPLRAPALTGMVFVIIAFVSGAVFLFEGANDLFSYSMATGFLFSFGSYAFLAAKAM